MKRCEICGKVQSEEKYEYLFEYHTDDKTYVICEECEDKHLVRSQIMTDCASSRFNYVSFISILGNTYVFDHSIPMNDIHDNSKCWIKVESKEELDRLCRPRYYELLDLMK